MGDSSKRIMIVTGEASGDLHGAKLMSAITAQLPDTKFFGVGGKNMAAKGCEILIPGEELAVMGIVEIVGHLPVILKAFNKLKREFYGSNKPDALVLIDFPEFNLRLARQAKKAGIPVLYYVSPQVWAWRRGRVKKIAAVVDSLAAIFPFEPAFYAGQDILVKYVGHPLLDEFEEAGNCQNLRPRLQIAQGKKVVGLFPGSRHNELRYMLDTLVESAQLIFDKEPEAHFLVPVANTLSRDDIQSRFPTELPVSFIESDDATIYDVASSCDTILTVSGTVTLQIALVGTPMAIFYKVSPLTYSIGKRLIKVDHAGLANIVAEDRIVPEFIQDMATPQNLADEALRVLNDSRYANDMRSALEQVHTKLGEPGCSARVAEMLLQLL
ncbi:lipid-A-disaccharide synthase [Deltaproteobacteria bacterium IMCC39524]|nr:lipid-A-disaccharide synthase [Deltaproteobacteria bacterium IMCC39524]